MYSPDHIDMYKHIAPMYSDDIRYTTDATSFLSDCKRITRLLQRFVTIDDKPKHNYGFQDAWIFEGLSGSSFLDKLYTTMVDVYRLHKHKMPEAAFKRLKDINHTYWYEACALWLHKRNPQLAR
jgi:hypothetical protein